MAVSCTDLLPASQTVLFLFKVKETKKTNKSQTERQGWRGELQGLSYTGSTNCMQPRTAMSKIQHKTWELLKTSQVVPLGFHMWPETICLCLVWLREPKAWTAFVCSRSSHTWPPRCWTWPPRPSFPYCLHSLYCLVSSLVQTGVGAKAVQLFAVVLVSLLFLWSERRERWDPKEGHIQTGEFARGAWRDFFFSRLFLNDVFYSFHTLFLNKTP